MSLARKTRHVGPEWGSSHVGKGGGGSQTIEWPPQREIVKNLSPNVERMLRGASQRHPNVHPTTPSRGQPCLVTNLSTYAYSPLPPFKSHRRRLPSPPRLLPRRLRPGGIRRPEPVPRAPRDRHAALITAASSNRICQTPPAQRVSARMTRAFE